MDKVMYTAEVYKKVLYKASVNIKAENRKKAKEIAEKFINDLSYKKLHNCDHFIVIKGGK